MLYKGINVFRDKLSPTSNNCLPVSPTRFFILEFQPLSEVPVHHWVKTDGITEDNPKLSGHKLVEVTTTLDRGNCHLLRIKECFIRWIVKISNFQWNQFFTEECFIFDPKRALIPIPSYSSITNYPFPKIKNITTFTRPWSSPPSSHCKTNTIYGDWTNEISLMKIQCTENGVV